MKKLLFLTLIFTTAAIYSNAQNNVSKDEALYEKARTALAREKCRNALSALTMVSLDGKAQPTYNTLMAQMHECMGNADQAAFFYRKATMGNASDTVQARINALESSAEKNREINVGHKSERKKYGLFGLALTPLTGGNDRNYKTGLEMQFTRGVPIFNRHAMLEFNGHMGMFLGANKVWFANALGTTTADIESIGPAIVPGLSVGLQPVVYRNKKMYLSAGLTGGIRLPLTISSSYGYTGSANKDNLSLATFTCGLKARYYYKHKLTAFVAYEKFMIDHVTAFTTYDVVTVPVKMSMISLGIGVYTRFKN